MHWNNLRNSILKKYSEHKIFQISNNLVNEFRNLEAANQDVPKDLMDLAMQSSWFKNSRFQKGRGKGAGGAGLGYRDRPAIGYDPSSNEV